jgi:Acetyltransferase (GNAT) domain
LASPSVQFETDKTIKARSRSLSTVKIFRDFDWDDIREQWREWAQEPVSDPDMFRTMNPWHSDAVTPYVLALYDEDCPEAILIGRNQQARFHIKVGPSRIQLPARIINFIYGGALGDLCPHNCRLLILEVLRSLREGEADVATFTGIPARSALYQQLLACPGLFGRDHVPDVVNRWGTAVPENPEDLYRRFSSHRRLEVRRKMRKFAASFAATFKVRCFHDPADLPSVVRDVEEVAKKSFQRTLGSGFIDSPSSRQWLSALAKGRILRCFILYINHTPVAFWIGSLYKGVFHGNYMAHDPKYSRHSPGVFLMMDVIEGFCTRRNADVVSYIDYGIGDFPYKTWMCDDKLEQADLHIFASTFKGLYLNAVRTPLAALDRVARKTAANAGVLDQIRKLRRAAAQR